MAQKISPLRQRMIDDMRMCKLSPKTQLQYIRAVRRLTGFVGRSPDTVTVEDLRRYQLHLVDHGTSPVSINAAITGLKFFFEVTLDRRDLMSKMRPVRVPYKLPVVLSREEAARLIAAAGKHGHPAPRYGTVRFERSRHGHYKLACRLADRRCQPSPSNVQDAASTSRSVCRPFNSP